MKTVLTLLMLATGFGAMAQQVLSSKEVTNDGHQLRIRVDVDQPGRPVHYSRTFDVSAMDARARQLLETHVLDSLNQLVAASGDGQNERDERAEANSGSPLSPGDVAPSSVQYREDKENGRLWMQYIFHKNDEELIVERTANVLGKTERAKQAIIRETERSLGIKTMNQ